MNEEYEIKEIKDALLKLERKNRRLSLGFYTLMVLLVMTFVSFVAIENLTARYEFLTGRPVEIFQGRNYFKVRLPLLRLKK